MLFSEARRFVFVAVPKTGTTALQQRLLKIDPDIRRNEVLDAAGNWKRMHTHATAQAIRETMGDRAADYVFVTFLRDPFEATRSRYYFYRNGRPAQMLRTSGIALRKRPRDGKVTLGLALKVLAARITPFPVWAVLYPFKHEASFVTDRNGRLLVDRVGDFGRLQAEVCRIFGDFGYDLDSLQLGAENRSEYARDRDFGSVLRAILSFKLRRDLDLYDRICRRDAAPARSDG